MEFNKEASSIMHIDLNSCFATVEQQANPLLRGKPVAVAAYTTNSGCILAPSVEAKSFGVKTGMRVKDGKTLCPRLVVLASDPNKYRQVHLSLRKLLSDYTNEAYPKSIDEFVLNLKNYPAFQKGMRKTAMEIKKRIKGEIGEWLTVSVGISTNRFLAKTASSLNKPDGLDEINKGNFERVYKRLNLTDLSGIAHQNKVRLNSVGIYTVTDFFVSPLWKLKAAFSSINSYYWYLRLRGWEIDDFESKRGSFGNSYALPKPYSEIKELSPILAKLTEKTGVRLRAAGYRAKGVHISLNFKDGGFWHKGMSFPEELFDSRDIYRKALLILEKSPRKRVSILAVTCFNLRSLGTSQLEFFSDVEKKERITTSIDEINERWGDFVVGSGRILALEDEINDRISFGGVREL